RSKRWYGGQAAQAAVVDVVLRQRGAVAEHEESLLGLAPQQPAVAELVGEEVLHRAAHVRPQLGPVGLEDGPLGALLDRALEVGEVAPHVEVLPLGVGAGGPRAPDPEAAALEPAQAVDAFGGQAGRLALVEQQL